MLLLLLLLLMAGICGGRNGCQRCGGGGSGSVAISIKIIVVAVEIFGILRMRRKGGARYSARLRWVLLLRLLLRRRCGSARNLSF